MAYSQANLQAMSCTVMILYRLLGFQTSGTMDPFFTLIRTNDESSHDHEIIVYAEG